jgi:Fic family protein
MSGRIVTMTWQPNHPSNAPVSDRRGCKYDVFVPEPLVLGNVGLDGKTLGIVSEAEQSIQALNALPQPASKPLARLLLRTEAIASSKVEGMQMGVRELARAEAKKEAGEKTGQESLEILANIDAMEEAVEEAARVSAFSINEIREIHRLLTKDAWNSHIAGKIRTVQNWIGGNDYNPCGSDYAPPPPEHVESLLGNLCEAINDDAVSPLVQAAMVHAQFETIHPFDDGNGRTGRALIQVVLRRRGIAASYVPPISVILARSKGRYISWLVRFREEGGEIDWIRQFAEATTAAANLARSYLGAIQTLLENWKSTLASSVNPRADSVAWTIIDELPGHPIITAPIAGALTLRSKPSVHKAMKELEQAGVLLPLYKGARNRSWEAAGLLELLASLENGEMPHSIMDSGTATQATSSSSAR